jgi:hypothetical protein
MPEETPLPIDDPQAGDHLAAAEVGPSLFAKVRILIFVTLVIAAECALAWLYLPSAAQTADMVGAAAETDAQAAASSDPSQSPQPEDELAGCVEVDLGEFSVVAYQPATGTTLRIDFHLWGMVHQDEADELLTLMNEQLHRFREQIHSTVRSAAITDLTDARLALIKRKAREGANIILGKPLLQDVIFDDFSLIEQ